jgi:hypothetical protein
LGVRVGGQGDHPVEVFGGEDPAESDRAFLAVLHPAVAEDLDSDGLAGNGEELEGSADLVEVGLEGFHRRSCRRYGGSFRVFLVRFCLW